MEEVVPLLGVLPDDIDGLGHGRARVLDHDLQHQLLLLAQLRERPGPGGAGAIGVALQDKEVAAVEIDAAEDGLALAEHLVEGAVGDA